ncbi:hypothetical protein [Roseovarius spongiae]|uniref:hypothetical protein n=1 Tax=Roseovarius spongiae TaxID=2320272 RepID=UPI0014075D1F|nr:hypothetical protein [Roseovarius spongiae]
MTARTIFATLVLTLAPTLALAMGCSHDRVKTQAMSCAEGSTYDAGTGACVPLASS